MSKKIVVVPTFCESHFIKYQIPNIIDTLAPDYIIYSEGLFPNGTEGNKHITSEWLDKYTLDGKRGFDYKDLKKIIEEADKKYINTKIILSTFDYPKNFSSTQCYVQAASSWEKWGIDIEEGDYIFPFEGDIFHHEKDKDLISSYLKQIEPGQGFRSMWIDYMQNFWYVEKSRIKPFLEEEKHHYEGNYMSRRICVRYDKGGQFYHKVLNNFMTTDYHNMEKGYGMLFPTDLITYHYAWVRPGKFRELRCDQLQRQSGYWETFVQALDRCDLYEEKEILVRPSKKDITGGYVMFFDKLEHPKHIKEHELWTDLK